jgi:hypothetical protein
MAFSERIRERLAEESLCAARAIERMRQVGTGGWFPGRRITAKSGLSSK